MSSALDPAKLKVVELRAELSKRGLDSKGNKPALVKRLKEALEEELKQELPDTSIVDTSTEDLDTSQTQDDSKSKEKIKDTEKVEEQSTPTEETQVSDVKDKTAEKENALKSDEPTVETTDKQVEPEQTDVEVPATQESADTKEENDSHIEEDDSQIEENKENGEQENLDKNCLGAETDNAEPMQQDENQAEPMEVTKTDKDAEQKGEKRRRSSPSPDRLQRRRSKSPIKEDEPPIDNEKVQLSWYDSDLHLQVDKESFLSAKPYHEGAFGFAWAGVRATHGINAGKACFEVKVTEELKWEDFSKYYDKHRRDHKSVSKHKTEEEKKEEVESKDTEEAKVEEEKENGDKTEKPTDAVVETKQDDEKEPAETSKESDQEPQKDDEPKTETMDTTEPPESENQEPAEPLPTHLFRVGWSLLDTGLQLGEDKYSYGYESSGKFVADKEFTNYGVQFGVGDVITSFLTIDDGKISISYAVNGEIQSEALSIPLSEVPENFVLFPHVLSRNYAFELNLGSKEEAWFALPQGHEDFNFLDKIDDKVAGPVRPENRSDCEVILMCGLPASGKTHWVREYVESNQDKRYTVLGNTHLLEKMTVSGDTLKSKYKGSWHILLEKLQKCINKLIEVAALRRRNYIIDQPNVYPSAQRRKLRPFEGFKRRAVVVVVGDEEQAKRQTLQEAQGGKDVPDSSVLDMKANMSLPQKGDWIDEVLYVGVEEEEAKTLVQKYNSQARETIGIQRRFGHRDDRHRWQNRRNDYRGGNYRDRNYHNNRYDRGPPRQGNWHPQRPGGWNRDRRDNRGPPMGGSRDWRNRDRGNRDSHGQVSNYNRNRNQQGRGPSGNWPSTWSQNQSSWGNQAWGGQGTWGQGGWGGQSNQNQWKYGGGSQGYGGYSNWNYYGQYAQNWGSQGQASGNANQYGQYSQQDWAQYAQQYVQQGQTPTTQSTPQK